MGESGLNSIPTFIEMNREEILQEWIEQLFEEKEQYSNTVTEQVFVNIANEYVNILNTYYFTPDQDISDKAHELSQKLVQAGWPIHMVTRSLNSFERIVFQKMAEKETAERHVDLLWYIEQTVSPINAELLQQYTASYERTISLQKIALQELSAPLIPVFEHITVMPLVGTIDTDRAKRIMENLLNGVVKYRSEVVLIDITGVPVVDTMVAHHIIQAAEAVRLVGAKCLLVGIRPEIAQTIVNLGIDLNKITTKNTLLKGIEAALAMTNRKIVEMGVE
ncbi:STAS domain-containing protein [Bacillus sp. FJAT-47783]|uniref:STAS domain-containing protein n=1 Tax=Bacillus sp. FJAT-47783 TaxID=2922712 RepID=UPI001FACF0B9|nr:STAS domain-containing protein [Bacillus sp. FJAT-47783]